MSVTITEQAPEAGLPKVAVLYVCTGNYVAFWEDFYKTSEELFCTDAHKEYFVFTDAEELFAEDNPRVHKIEQEDLGWPGNTLYRYRMFLRAEEELKSFDYICFLNANILVMQPISTADFFPEEGITAVLHMGFYNKPSWFYTYERRKESTAYMPYFSWRRRLYVAGGINGGTAKSYLDMVHAINECIEIDDENGITALLHDESHFNHYVDNLDSYKLLPPDYNFPEGWKMPFTQILFLREKRRYIEVPDKPPEVPPNVRDRTIHAVMTVWDVVYYLPLRVRERLFT